MRGRKDRMGGMKARKGDEGKEVDDRDENRDSNELSRKGFGNTSFAQYSKSPVILLLGYFYWTH